MSHPIPKTITLDQYVAATRAFWAVLDVDPAYLYYPVILDRDRITAPAVPVPEENPGGRPKSTPAHNAHPQGDEFGEYSCMVTLRVADMEPDRPLYGDVHIHQGGIDPKAALNAMDRVRALDGNRGDDQ